MAGLGPAIHVFTALEGHEAVDARDERGHDVDGCKKMTPIRATGGNHPCLSVGVAKISAQKTLYLLPGA